MGMISFRSFIYIAIIWIAVTLTIYSKEYSWSTVVHDAAALQMESNKQTWEVIRNLSDNSTINHVTDYTFWDDMVDFAESTHDDAWAAENLDSGLETINLAALWVLRVDGTTRYSAAIGEDSVITAPSLPLNLAELRIFMATSDENSGPVRRFYWFSPIGPLSVFGAEVTTTDDPNHEKPARGYFFVASKITDEQIQNQLKTIHATIGTIATSSLPPEITPDESQSHVFWHRMYDHTDTTIGAIRVARSSDAFSKLIATTQQDRYVTSALWIMTGLIATSLVMSLSRTQKRAESLAAQITSQLRSSNTLLERRVDDRTKELADDIKRREAFEQQLEKRTDELERMNKVMLDRELRIAELKKKVSELEGSGTSST